MATQLNIISNSLSLLGRSPITTLSSPDEITAAAIQAYDLLLPGVLSRNNWRFATKIGNIYRQVYPITAVAGAIITATSSGFVASPTTIEFETTGTLPTSTPQVTTATTYYAVVVAADTFNVYETYQDAIAATNAITFANIGTGTNSVAKIANPESQWKSIYTIPSDFLKLIRMHPQNYQYEMYGNEYYSTGRDNILTLEYIYQPDPANFPQRFTEYFVYEIAAYLALSNAQRPDFYSVLEQKRQLAFAMAAASEAQNRPNFTQASFPMLDARNVTLLNLPNSLS